MTIEEIPYMTAECTPQPESATLPIHNMIDEIVDDKNISDSFDYVIDHLESAQQREHIRPKKAVYCSRLKYLLQTGKFCIRENDFRELHVKDGPKARIVQCPKVFHRVGCHAIMVPFERHTYPTLITNTAASIKGRGMHWLHQIVEEDILADPENMRYYYQSDIYHYYDSINQDIVKLQVREYTDDSVLLPMMDNFITLLPKERGISKGLRSSQCLANLHLNKVDHAMCKVVTYHLIEASDSQRNDGECVVAKGIGEIRIDGKIVRFHYYRYCDDIVFAAADKKTLWKLRDMLVALLAELGLRLKPNEAIRPMTIGLDYLGYNTFQTEEEKSNGEVVYGCYSRIRKRTKQKFARRIKNVKSRKRRQQLIGSFFGMAAHADCRHLLKKLITPSEYCKLKHKRKMKEFGNFNVKPPTLDGKKNFKGDKVTGSELDHKGIIVVDFESDVVPRREREDYNRRLQAAAAQGIPPEAVEKPKTKYIVSLILDGRLRKLWTGDRELWQILDQIADEDGLPFFVGVVVDYSGQYKKINFVPAAQLNLRVPTDEELERLLTNCNIKL